MFIETMILDGQHAINQIGRDLFDVDEQAALSIGSKKARNFQWLQFEKGRSAWPAFDPDESALLKGKFDPLRRERPTRELELAQIGRHGIAAHFVFARLERFFAWLPCSVVLPGAVSNAIWRAVGRDRAARWRKKPATEYSIDAIRTAASPQGKGRK